MGRHSTDIAAAPLLDQAESSTALTLASNGGADVVLLDTEKFDAFYDKLKAEAPTGADVTTKKGQDALRSFAARVRSEKAAIDKARLALTKQWRDMTAQANAAGKVIEERLEGLAVEVRKPLTDWESAENRRIATCRDVIAKLKLAGNISFTDTVDTVRERGTEVWATKIDPEHFRDFTPEAQAAKDSAMASLKDALARLTREEEERAELEKLRAEKAERDRIETERIEAEAAERRREEQARAAEAERMAKEQAERDRIAQAERDAADKARREAEADAQRKLDEERRAREAAEAEAERVKREAETRARREQEQRDSEEAERKAREANQQHTIAVMGAAKAAIMTCGPDEETAKKIVLAIRAGAIPHVRIEF